MFDSKGGGGRVCETKRRRGDKGRGGGPVKRVGFWWMFGQAGSEGGVCMEKDNRI
jgi:hypothetical protein